MARDHASRYSTRVIGDERAEVGAFPNELVVREGHRGAMSNPARRPVPKVNGPSAGSLVTNGPWVRREISSGWSQRHAHADPR